MDEYGIVDYNIGKRVVKERVHSQSKYEVVLGKYEEQTRRRRRRKVMERYWF